MTISANLMGREPTYVAGTSKTVLLDSSSMKPVGCAKIGQRVAVHARLHADTGSAVKVRLSVCASGGSFSNLENNGGITLSTDDDPVEFYHPTSALIVAAQKYYSSAADVDVYMCSVDGSGECAKVPPLKVASSEAISTAGQALVNVTKPNGTLDGDLMICVVGVDSASVEPDLPVGWAWLGGTAAAARVIASANPTLRVAWKMAYGEGANYDWGKAASSQTWAAAIVAARVLSSGGDQTKYGIGLTAAIDNAMHGLSTTEAWAWFAGQLLTQTADPRFEDPTYQAFGPPLQVVIFGAYDSSAPGDPLAHMAWYDANPKSGVGGSALSANAMVGIGAGFIAKADAQWQAFQMGGNATPFKFQGCTISLLGM